MWGWRIYIYTILYKISNYVWLFSGTRKCGSSPEPPPPPPRNATNENNCSSSFNESKDSNEISEAECDQPRNYPGT